MKVVSFIILFLSTGSLFAQIKKVKDTISIPKIVIVDEKHSIFQINRKLVDSTFMMNNTSSSLADILLKNTSLHSRSYGPGLITSYGMRGGNSSETTVVWNGFSINNIMLASTDISLLTVSPNSKISIDKNNFIIGGIGGSIRIDDNILVNKNKTIFNINYNSLNNLDLSGTIHYSLKKLKNSFSLIYEDNNNKYFFNRGHSKIKITNSKGEKAIFKYNALYRKNKGTFKLFVLANKLVRQIPPSRYEDISDAVQLDEGIKSGIHFDFIENSYSMKLKAGYFIDRLKYRYPLKSIYSDSYIYTFQTGINLIKTINSNWLFNLDINNENTKIRTDIYDNKSENRIFISGVVSGIIHNRLLIKTGIKTVYFNNSFIPLFPYLQLNYKLNNHIRTILNMGNNFRLPGFNEKYWPDLGIPDLKYETSSFFDLNAYINIRNSVKINTSVYFKDSKDMILWIPKNGVWRPQNIKQVYSRGLEMELSYRMRNNIMISEFNLSYSYNKTSNNRNANYSIIYIPANVFLFNQRIKYNSWYLSLTQRFTDKVYVTYDNSESIPRYFIVDALLSKDFIIKKNKFKYIIEINNVFNAEYETIKNYPMPGRCFSVGLKYFIN